IAGAAFSGWVRPCGGQVRANGSRLPGPKPARISPHSFRPMAEGTFTPEVQMLKCCALLSVAVFAFAWINSAQAEVSSPLDFKVKDIDGKEVNLADYKGKVVLIVNVASKCGLTNQYEGL